MKTIATLRALVDEMNEEKITPEILEDLGFEKVLANDWKLEEDIPTRTDGYKSTMYVRYDEDDIALLEAHNLYGEVKIGNRYIYQSATLKDLLMTVELLKI